ncbi:MAG: helix-turn-helix transcriptional regulator [Gammaproteobacteria bacterium]|nr:helix-turn-helix transcriptional regulator [Gammaproteobacteria bacterium]
MKDFSARQLESAVEGLRVIAHPVRLSVLCQLVDGDRNVRDLQAGTGVTQSNLSQHLAKLRLLGLVTCERRGQHIYYRLSDPGFVRILEALKEVYCQDRADRPGEGPAS